MDREEIQEVYIMYSKPNNITSQDRERMLTELRQMVEAAEQRTYDLKV